MSDTETREIIALQESLERRLHEIGMPEPGRHSLARELAHIAVLGRSFAERTLPLLLSIEPDHRILLQELLMSMKRDLDELGDAIQDGAPQLSELIQKFAPRDRRDGPNLPPNRL